MASNFLININLANTKELKMFPGISNGRAKAIISTHNRLGGSMTVDDLKSITKIGYNVWQPLLEEGVITFGPPGPSGPSNSARSNHQASSTSDSSPEVPLNQEASSPEHSVRVHTCPNGTCPSPNFHQKRCNCLNSHPRACPPDPRDSSRSWWPQSN